MPSPTTRASRRRTSRSRSGWRTWPTRTRLRTRRRSRGARPSQIHFDSGPIRTRADGTFVTPPQLMTGWSYRIIIRPEGDPPVSSDSLTASTELTTFPPLRLQQRRKLVGRVHDRRGQPVAGARVFLPSGEPSTTTDAQGRFRLEGIFPPGPTCWSRPMASGFRAGRSSRPDSPRSGRSSSCGRANRPTARSLPCRPRSRWRSREPWPGGCSSPICKPRWKRATTTPAGMVSAS